MQLKNVVLGAACLAGLGSAHAGTMGPIVNDHTVPFLSGEFSATWQEANGATISRFRSGNLLRKIRIPDNLNPWGGRIAAGLISPYKNNFSFSAETAWNYFGDGSTRPNVNSNTRASVSIDGVDLLVGLFYQYNDHTRFFGKVGTLFQRVAYSTNANGIKSTLNDMTVTSNVKYKGLQTSILPEIRAGLLYGLADAWDFSVAYMHAFGSTPKVSASFNQSPTGGSASVNANTQNPTLNSVLIGLQYNFV